MFRIPEEVEYWVVLWIDPDNEKWMQFDAFIGAELTANDAFDLIREHLESRQFINPRGMLVSFNELPQFQKSLILSKYQSIPFSVKVNVVGSDLNAASC
jgi:hypothetical protein